MRRTRWLLLPTLLGLLLAACTDATGPQALVQVDALGGDAQAGEVGAALGQPLVVRLHDGQGQPLPNVPVRWVASAGGGALSPVFTFTDEAGRASARWTLGVAAGENLAKVSVPGTPPVVFRAEAVAGPPARLVLARDSAQLSALDDTLRLAAAVEDRYGNPLPRAALTWISLDLAVAGVEADGTVRARANGTARVLVGAGTQLDTARITVRQKVATLVLQPPADSVLLAGDTARLAVQAADARGFPVADAALHWHSSDAAVVQVDSGGRLLAGAAGSARIEVRADGVASEVELRVRLPRLRLAAREVTLEALGTTAPLAARIGEAPAPLPLQPRLLRERRWLHDVPVLDAEALAAGEVRAVGAGTALVEVGAAGAMPDTLRLHVQPRRSLVAALLLPPPLSDEPLRLRGYALDRVPLDGIRAGPYAVRVVARDSANLWLRLAGLPSLACGTPEPLTLSVAEADVATALRLEQPVVAPIALAPGEALRLAPAQAACLRLAPAPGARYALALLDTRGLRPGATAADAAPTLLVRDWSAAPTEAPAQRPAAAPTLPLTDHLFSAADPLAGAPGPWRAGQQLRPAALGGARLQLLGLYGEQLALATTGRAADARWQPVMDTALAVLQQIGVPLLRQVLSPALPASDAEGRQLLLVITRLGATAGLTQSYLPPAEASARSPAPRALLLLDADSLAAMDPAGLLWRLAHQLAHAWQARYLHDEGRDAAAPVLLGGAPAGEAVAELLADEVLRRYAGVPLDANLDAAAALDGLALPPVRAYALLQASRPATAATPLLHDLVLRRALTTGEPEDAALREVVRGALEGWYGTGERAPGLAARMRARLGTEWDPAEAVLRATLSRAVDDETDNPLLQAPSLLYAARVLEGRGGPAPLLRLRSGEGRTLRATWPAGSAHYLLLEDDVGGTFHLAADVEAPAWMLVRYR